MDRQWQNNWRSPDEQVDHMVTPVTTGENRAKKGLDIICSHAALSWRLIKVPLDCSHHLAAIHDPMNR